jgi:hypothetical protein
MRKSQLRSRGLLPGRVAVQLSRVEQKYTGQEICYPGQFRVLEFSLTVMTRRYGTPQ